MKRKNVGLFVSNLKDAYDRAIYNGVSEAAAQEDVNLFVFPGRYLQAQYADQERSRTDYQYNTVFSYARKENIDVLLVLLGTVGTVIGEEDKRTFLRDYAGIPTVLIADQLDGYPCICVDNKSGLREGIEELIEKKGRKCIGMVSGPLTNDDAAERLNVYKEVLAAHGMEIEESRIVYGNFSEYCEEQVGQLLDNNPGLDAIVFANDQMAKGGYNVFRERGLVVGRDIMVMGFDDSPLAGRLSPGLSSVRADAEELGREALRYALRYLDGDNEKPQNVGTSFVRRASTGEDTDMRPDTKVITQLRYDWEQNRALAADNLLKLHFGRFYELYEKKIFMEKLRSYLEGFFAMLLSGEPADEEQQRLYLDEALSDMVHNGAEPQLLFSLVGRLKDLAELCGEDAALIDCIIASQTQLNYSMADVLQKQDDAAAFVQWMSNSIARDMLTYDEESDESYWSVNDKLIRMGFTAAYLYALPKPFVNKNSKAWHDFKVPERFLLKSYFDGGEIIQLPEAVQEVDGGGLVFNRFMDPSRRYSMILNLIHINEEQLGYLVCETESGSVNNLPAIVAQLCAAFKIKDALKVLAQHRRKLEESLQEVMVNNEALEAISQLDELTGIYNRRGFKEHALELLNEPRNAGRTAILIYADLNHLKSINDGFGHEEGDFALRSAARILADSLRDKDIVARLGGDEYVALAVVKDGMGGDDLCARIREVMRLFNRNCEKPYYIEFSMGYAELVCGEALDLDKSLEEADGYLYEDKKKKRASVIKNK